MADGPDPQNDAGDELDFQPLGARPKPAAQSPRPNAAQQPRTASDGIDFQPAGAQPRAAAPGAPQPTPTSPDEPQLKPDQPSAGELLRRTVANSALGSALRETAPKLFGRILQPTTTVNDPEYEQHRRSVIAASEVSPRPGILRGVNETIEGLTSAPNLVMMAGGPALGAETLLEPAIGKTGVQTLSRLVGADSPTKCSTAHCGAFPGCLTL